MPRADFGQKVNLGGGSEFVRLESKGDKIQFRFGAGAQYEGIHFLKQADGTTTKSYCPRIMTQGENECEFCKKYFELRKVAKAEQDKNIREKLLKEAKDKFGVAVKFYFPILDRTAGAGQGKAKILQCALSVRTKVEAMVEAGVKVLNSEFVLTRTEQPGSDYYSLVRLDSAEVDKLTKEEEAELQKAKQMDLEAILGHETLESSMEMEGGEPA